MNTYEILYADGTKELVYGYSTINAKHSRKNKNKKIVNMYYIPMR